jgi:hypothetical protein
MVKSLNDARYTMWATVIPQLVQGDVQPTGGGHFERASDADSGEVTETWVAGAPGPQGIAQAQFEIPCYARGYTALGYRSSANREIYVGGEYNIAESIQLDYPPGFQLNHQSLITNIRNGPEPGDLTTHAWLNDDGTQSLVWEVQGITPVHDPFGKLIRFTTVLKRAEIQ